MFVSQQVRAQNAVREGRAQLKQLAARARAEDGEIGSQLILMAVLVAAAVFAVTTLRGPLSSLISGIGGDLGTDTSVGGE